jgi:Spy/CpxP family protein refolding chaperone
MKDNLLKYVLILSLLLNFSLLGAAGYTYYRQNRYGTAPFGHEASGQAPECSSIHPYLFKALSLKPEQRKLFDQKALLFHQALDKKGEQVDRLRKSLFAIIEADYPDNRAIEKTIAEINGVQEDMQKMIVAHMLDFKSMLDKEQQKKFFGLIRGAMKTGQEIQCP